MQINIYYRNIELQTTIVLNPRYERIHPPRVERHSEASKS